ncbi:unnamed protein product [Darwinula stevensoni]|uniref:LysM domain-containing protein n=1 Tax=Darwinula stevensoni TaxID=69355 RepID=A0A7R9ADI9_9CRUS|nr:unnamed protein product [Darwinula stevensoni]CAG0901017.1 unnamed protein product [Darwinula stevensoni]
MSKGRSLWRSSERQRPNHGYKELDRDSDDEDHWFVSDDESPTGWGSPPIDKNEIPMDDFVTDGLKSRQSRHRLQGMGNGEVLMEEAMGSSHIRVSIPTCILEKEIEPNDTLQGLALKYHCTVSELKRLNNISTDQHIYALRVLKIPAKEHGLLTENLPPPPRLGPRYKPRLRRVSDGSDSEDDLFVKTVSIGKTFHGRDFLAAMDRDLEAIRLKTSTSKASLEDVVDTLNSKRFHPMAFDTQTSTGTQLCSGADWGLPWVKLISFSICVVLVLPLLGLGYYWYVHPHMFS